MRKNPGGSETFITFFSWQVQFSYIVAGFSRLSSTQLIFHCLLLDKNLILIHYTKTRQNQAIPDSREVPSRTLRSNVNPSISAHKLGRLSKGGGILVPWRTFWHYWTQSLAFWIFTPALSNLQPSIGHIKAQDDIGKHRNEAKETPKVRTTWINVFLTGRRQSIYIGTRDNRNRFLERREPK